MCVIEDFYPMDYYFTIRWKVNDTISQTEPVLEYKLNDEGLYTAQNLYKVSSETWNANTNYTCEVTHQGKTIIEKKNFKSSNAPFTLTLKPPIERDLFVNDKVILEAVVSGDVKTAVNEASVSCIVKNESVISVTGTINFSQDISQFIRIHNITVDIKKWFDGEMVTCTIHDTINNRDIKQEIRFDKGDGLKPSVVIYTPDSIDTDKVSLVCEVTSPKLGNVYIMWKVGEEPYIKGSTSTPIHQRDSTSVLSILTISKQEYEKYNTITCSVIHANMNNRRNPLQVSTSQRKQPELSCD
uniref:Immunoglobulin heavy constant zeta n=1 Tax=Sinocyclocheilus rhinocerous TaxID=307959 RepID=A0A673JLK6_9TELE